MVTIELKRGGGTCFNKCDTKTDMMLAEAVWENFGKFVKFVRKLPESFGSVAMATTMPRLVEAGCTARTPVNKAKVSLSATISPFRSW